HHYHAALRDLHSFPTRRSSDLFRAPVLSADGTLLAVASDSDTNIILVDIASGKALRTFQGHSGRINSIQFSSDNSRIITGSDDGDRKSTRLNSSHRTISYAVFC